MLGHAADGCLPGLALQAADGVKRAQRGGMLTGAMLAAVASLLTGATRLQRAIISAAAASQEGGQISEASPIWPIYAPIKVRAVSFGNSCPWGVLCSCKAGIYIDQASCRQRDWSELLCCRACLDTRRLCLTSARPLGRTCKSETLPARRSGARGTNAGRSRAG